MKPTGILLAGAIAAVAVSGCSSTEVATERLPFRVAIAPATIQLLRPDENPEFALQFTEAAVSEALSKVLHENESFVAIEMLDVEESETPTRVELARRAREARADLLIEPYLEAGPAVEGSINEKFWLNLPLFAIGGPFCYWVSDRRYAFEVNMNLTATSLASVPDGGSPADLDRNAVFPRPIGERLQELDLNFASRSGYQWSSVLASMAIPAGLLSKSGDNVRAALEQEILETMSQRFADQIRGRGSELLKLRHLVPFYVDNSSVAVTRSGSTLELSCNVILERDKGVDFLEGYTIRVGEITVEKAFADPIIDGTRSRYEVRETVDLAAAGSAAGALRFEVRDASMDENARSYTFAVAGARGQ